MDDPIFEPWSETGTQPATPRPAQPPNRWRPLPWSGPEQPPVSSPSIPGPERPSRQRANPKRRLKGTTGYLRTMAIPRLEDVVQRLLMARHEADLEDLLEEDHPRILLTLRPWLGPWAETAEVVTSRLEVAVENGGEEQVVVRVWFGQGSDHDGIARITAPKLSAQWLERRVLEFVDHVLDRS